VNSLFLGELSLPSPGVDKSTTRLRAGVKAGHIHLCRVAGNMHCVNVILRGMLRPIALSGVPLSLLRSVVFVDYLVRWLVDWLVRSFVNIWLLTWPGSGALPVRRVGGRAYAMSRAWPSWRSPSIFKLLYTVCTLYLKLTSLFSENVFQQISFTSGLKCTF